jgi:hypothetical protein
MAGWLSWTKIAMLWAFFDESGWHPDNGKLAKLTVGGCIASYEAWQSLMLDWPGAIAGMGIDCFHMTDFEARVPPYKAWTDQQRKDRLNVLLDIIGTVKPACCGFTNLWRPAAPDLGRPKDDTTESMYKRCAHDVLLELVLYNDEFSVVFAHHPEFAAYSPLHQMLMQYGYGKQIREVTIGLPIDWCPLQAADIVAFEIRCQEREDGRPKRYPIKRLSELGCTFKLSPSGSLCRWHGFMWSCWPIRWIPAIQ